MLNGRIAVHDTPMTELWDVTCHIGSHSVTCHPTQVNAPRPNPSPQAGTRFTYPGAMEGWVDLGGWAHICQRRVTDPSSNRAQCLLTTLILI